MGMLKKLEKQIEVWLKPIPHLPADWRKWLGENVWWITIVGIALNVLGVYSSISNLYLISSEYWDYTTTYNNMFSISGGWMIMPIVSAIFTTLIVVISIMAINPLQNKQMKGWDLLFISLLVYIVSAIVGIVINPSFIYIIPTMIFIAAYSAIAVAISAYLLFEIRSQFSVKVADKK